MTKVNISHDDVEVDCFRIIFMMKVNAKIELIIKKSLTTTHTRSHH